MKKFLTFTLLMLTMCECYSYTLSDVKDGDTIYIKSVTKSEIFVGWYRLGVSSTDGIPKKEFERELSVDAKTGHKIFGLDAKEGDVYTFMNTEFVQWRSYNLKNFVRSGKPKEGNTWPKWDELVRMLDVVTDSDEFKSFLKKYNLKRNPYLIGIDLKNPTEMYESKNKECRLYGGSKRIYQILLRNGYTGEGPDGVVMGMTATEVKKLLGTPSKEEGDETFWRISYAKRNLRFTFKDGKLFIIHKVKPAKTENENR